METYQIAVALFGAAVLVFAWVRSRPSYDIIDGSRWISGIRNWILINRFRRSGLLVDGRRRISEKRSRQHLLICAPSGAGKTSLAIIPSLLGMNGKSSAVVTDPSGEIFEQTSGRLDQLGYRIAVLDVSDNIGRSLSFNPLHRANTATEINKVSDVLISSAYPNDTGGNKFWNDSAKSLLSILIRTLKNGDPKYANLANVRSLLNHFGSEGKGLDPFMSKHADRKTFDDYEGFRSNSDRVLSNIVATTRTAVGAFEDPKLCQISSSDTIDFETLRERPTALYLITPEHEANYYSFWLSLVYVQLFNFAMKLPERGKPYLPITFLLDEIGCGARIPGLLIYVSTLRKRKCSLVLSLQDTEQLVNIYGRSNATAILNGGISSKIYLPGLGLNVCQELERTLGKQTLEDRDTGQRFQQSLMAADEIRTMRDGTGVLISGNSHPAKLRMKPFYKRRKFKRYSKIPPPEIKGSENSAPDYIDLRRDEQLRPLPDVQSDIIRTNGNSKREPVPTERAAGVSRNTS